MNIYLLEQNINRGYDTYDSFVCIAKTEEEAKNTMPSEELKWGAAYSPWANRPSDVKAIKIGTADSAVTAGIVCSSFNAG